MWLPQPVYPPLQCHMCSTRPALLPRKRRSGYGKRRSSSGIFPASTPAVSEATALNGSGCLCHPSPRSSPWIFSTQSSRSSSKTVISSCWAVRTRIWSGKRSRWIFSTTSRSTACLCFRRRATTAIWTVCQKTIRSCSLTEAQTTVSGMLLWATTSRRPMRSSAR